MSVFLDTERDRKGPEYVFFGGRTTPQCADGWKAASLTAEPLRCGYDSKLDYSKDVALVRIDRARLDRPGAVRVEVRTGESSPPVTPPSTWLGAPGHFTPLGGLGLISAGLLLSVWPDRAVGLTRSV
jgi:hypothetical protein